MTGGGLRITDRFWQAHLHLHRLRLVAYPQDHPPMPAKEEYVQPRRRGPRHKSVACVTAHSGANATGRMHYWATSKRARDSRRPSPMIDLRPSSMPRSPPQLVDHRSEEHRRSQAGYDLLRHQERTGHAAIATHPAVRPMPAQTRLLSSEDCSPALECPNYERAQEGSTCTTQIPRPTRDGRVEAHREHHQHPTEPPHGRREVRRRYLPPRLHQRFHRWRHSKQDYDQLQRAHRAPLRSPLQNPSPHHP
jgi:hypothetical protein